MLEIHRYMLKPRKKGQRKPTGALEAGDEAARSKFLVCEDISRGQVRLPLAWIPGRDPELQAPCLVPPSGAQHKGSGVQ